MEPVHRGVDTPTSDPRPWTAAILALFVLGAGTDAVAAQDHDEDSDVEELRRRVELQELELAELRARQDALETPPDDGLSLDDFTGPDDAAQPLPEYGSEATVVDIHGFTQAQYVDYENAPSTFDLQNAFLFFGADLGDYAQVWTEVEYEHGSELIELDQAELRLLYEGTTLGLGRFYGPFGIERRHWYPSSNPLVTRPDAFRHVVPNSWYETGVRVDHSRDLGGWRMRAELSLTNGLGDEANTDIRAARGFRDNNSGKALIGRLGLAPSEDLEFGLSAATMEYARDDAIEFVGLDVEYKADPWLLRAEAVQSSVEDSVGALGNFDREGLYLLLSREVFHRDRQRLDLSLRYDLLDGNDRLVDELDYSAFSIAAKWHPLPSVVVVPEWRFFEGRHGGDPADDSAFLLGVSIEF